MIRRILKNRLIISGLCIFLAGIVAFGLIPNMYRNQAATTQLVVANTEIGKGESISEAMLKTVEIGAYGLPANLLTDKALIAGKYAAVDMKPDDYFMESKLQDYRFSQAIDAVIKEEKRLVTVTLPSIASGLSSHLEQGDIVTVANFIPEKERYTPDGVVSEPSQVILYPELQELTIYDIENARTESAAEVRDEGDKNSTGYDPIPKTVTFIVTEAQAEKLIEAEYKGMIHLIFIARSVK